MCWTIEQPSNYIRHFLPFFFRFLPPFLSLPPPQITAVFTRALRDLPTRPRVRSHSPHRAKKTLPKSYRASRLLTHCLCLWTLCFVSGDCILGACRCMSRQPCDLLKYFSHCKILFSLTFSRLVMSCSISFHLASLVCSVTDLPAKLYC